MGPLLWGEIRRRWRSAAVTGLVLGVGFAAVLSAAAGARRTDTAFPRMLAATEAPQLLVSSGNEDSDARQRLYQRVAAVDGVEQIGAVAGVGLVPARVPKGAGTAIEACSNLSLDGRAWYALGRPNLLEGRLPRPDRSEEILVSHGYAATFGVGVGDEVDFVMSPDASVAGEANPEWPVVHATIVGVGVLVGQVVPLSDLETAPVVVAGPAFVARHAPEDRQRCYDAVMVRGAPEADLDRIAAEIDAAAEPFGGAFVQDLTANYAEVRRAIHPQVTALWLFAAAAAIATLLVVAQVIGRQLRQWSAANARLWRALGATRAQVRCLIAVPSLVTAVVGSGLAVTCALLASSRFPIGPARLAETNGGTRVDAWVHLGGALAVAVAAVVIGLAAAVAAMHGGSRTPPRPRTAGISRAASHPALVLGMHLATDHGRGETSVPVRSALAGTSFAVAAMMATVAFAGGLHDLVSEPARYGRDWDVMVDASFALAPVGSLLRELGDDPSVAAIAGGRYGEVTIQGTRVPTVGITDLVGTTFPALIDGHAPRRADEVVVGKRSLRDIGASIGDTVTVDTGLGPQEMTIVGSAAFPRLNHGSFSTLGLGTGAMTRAEAFPPRGVGQDGELPPGLDPGDFLGPGNAAFEFVTIRLRATATAEDRWRVLEAARRTGKQSMQMVRTEQRPTAIDNYAAVRSTPAVLAVLLGGLAAATLAHLLVSAGRRRGRDLALCVALGMGPAQVSGAVVIQAVLVAGASMLVGLPVGLAAGRLAWVRFTSELGVVDDLRIPLVAVALVVPVVVVGAMAVAVVPALVASRKPPARSLRSEAAPPALRHLGR